MYWVKSEGQGSSSDRGVLHEASQSVFHEACQGLWGVCTKLVKNVFCTKLVNEVLHDGCQGMEFGTMVVKKWWFFCFVASKTCGLYEVVFLEK